MRAFLLFGYDQPNAPRLTLEAIPVERHGNLYVKHETRFYRVRERHSIGQHVYVQGERVKVSLVEES